MTIKMYRYNKTDVGRLLHFGQGNCHTVASLTAAVLIPFCKVIGTDFFNYYYLFVINLLIIIIIGFELRFRAGFFMKRNRDLDSNGNPLDTWNKKPRSIFFY